MSFPAQNLASVPMLKSLHTDKETRENAVQSKLTITNLTTVLRREKMLMLLDMFVIYQLYQVSLIPSTCVLTKYFVFNDVFHA